MRKANKIMIMTVSVLLTLVLFTSTALSGTLAKYVSSDSMSATARVAKWGVNIDVWVDTAKLKTVCPDSAFNLQVLEKEKGETTNATVEIKGLKMGPGDNLDDVIKFSFSGQPEVKVRVKLTMTIDYKTNDFKVPKGIGNNPSDIYYMPISFRFSALNSSGQYIISPSYVLEPFRHGSGISLELSIAKAIADKIDMKSKSVSTDDYVYKDFAPTKSIVFKPDIGSGEITQFGLGFYYPFDYSRDYTYEEETYSLDIDEIGTWLAKNKPNSTISVKYTLSIEQITS